MTTMFDLAQLKLNGLAVMCDHMVLGQLPGVSMF